MYHGIYYEYSIINVAISSLRLFSDGFMNTNFKPIMNSHVSTVLQTFLMKHSKFSSNTSIGAIIIKNSKESLQQYGTVPITN